MMAVNASVTLQRPLLVKGELGTEITNPTAFRFTAEV